MPGYAITDRPDGIRTVRGDAAVLELAAPVPDAVPLPLLETSPEVGRTGRILGRGLTGPQPAGSPDTVQQAGVRVVAPSACQATIADRYDFDQSQSVCVEGIANTATSTVVPCSGDSGGPLVIGTGSSARLAGIASYLDRRDNCDDPTVRLAAYTDTAAIRDWAVAPDLVLAPAQVTAPSITGTPAVGSSVSCQSEWTDPRAQLTTDWTIGDRGEDGSLVPVDGKRSTA
ncbi:trypsin-like serine protease [Rhodococcus sp. NPDC059234]|uniref:trypsin-like serine protease n=1 Tax=Rhodococcus sp. NPDC059234 TaxID=3346781 RepID=UPI00366FCE73